MRLGPASANDYNDLESQAREKLVTIMEANSTILAKREHTTLMIPCAVVCPRKLKKKDRH